jgi:hypothetical protein
MYREHRVTTGVDPLPTNQPDGLSSPDASQVTEVLENSPARGCCAGGFFFAGVSLGECLGARLATLTPGHP